jgi:hypothetical protein
MAKKFYIEENESIPAIIFAETSPVGFIEITDQDELKKLHAQRYKDSHDDGVEYVRNYTAQLYLDIINGIITTNDAFIFEVYTESLLKQIESGHWLTAKNTNENLTLSGIYDQERKDAIQSDIDLYISENY